MKTKLSILALLLVLATAAYAQLGTLPYSGASSVGASLACSYTPVTAADQSLAYTGATPSASGGTPSYTFSETGSLPTGVTINTSTGVLSGTPSTNGSYTGIQVKVTDNVSATANCGASFTLTVAATTTISYTPVTSATYNVAYTGATPTSTGGTGSKTYSSTGSSLPPGFTISPSTGIISGTDTVDSGGASYPSLVVTVTDSLGQTASSSSFTITVAAGGGYSGLGDVVSGAKFYWGLRAYSAAKRGTKIANICMTISLVDTCVDMNSDATTGALSLGTIGGLTCNNSTQICNIKTWYDQSGATACSGSSACDMTQSTVANRAILVLSCNGSLPCARYTGSNLTNYQTSNWFSTSQPISFSTVINRTGDTSNYQSVFNSGSNFAWGFNNATNAIFMYSTSSVPTATANDNAVHSMQLNFHNATASGAYIDGTNTVMSLGASTGIVGSDPVNLGRSPAASQYFTGDMYEIGMWAADNSSSNSSLCHNQYTYWGTATSC